MSVCLSVGMWRANGNPHPCTDLDKILHEHPHLSKEGLGAGLTPAASPRAWGPKIVKVEGHIFENCLQNKRCLAGYKLTWAAPGTSASLYDKIVQTIFNSGLHWRNDHGTWQGIRGFWFKPWPALRAIFILPKQK